MNAAKAPAFFLLKLAPFVVKMDLLRRRTIRMSVFVLLKDIYLKAVGAVYQASILMDFLADDVIHRHQGILWLKTEPPASLPRLSHVA